MERIYINKEELQKIETHLSLLRHIERYGLIRQFLYGKVLDCACGVGYGTYLCSQNPDVDSIIGIDIDNDAIAWAHKHFSAANITFINSSIEDFCTSKIDVLVSLETIEHLENPMILSELANRCNINEILVSFPTKKTTHYNKHHFYDLTKQEVLYIFENYVLINQFVQANEFLLLHLMQRKEKGSSRKRYNVRHHL
jgi:2-polyprenyl-3-methyl-5-hydroxy-6-metoxy-1,4-benzoquinol methylase